jgi:hypothetical protein
VWTAIALHTTSGIPPYMHPVVALVTAGVEMDVLGLNYPEYSDEVRKAVVAEYPRTPNFKEDIIQAFCDAIHKKPENTFGTSKLTYSQTRTPSSYVATSAASCAALARPSEPIPAGEIAETRKEL